MPVFGLPAFLEKGYRDVFDEPKVALGGCFVSNVDDVLISYVRFAEDVKEGDLIQTKYNHFAPADDAAGSFRNANDEIIAAGTQKVEITGAAFKTSLAGFPEEPTLRDYAIIAIRAGDGAGQRGYITHYTDTVLNVRWYDTDDGTLKTAIGNSGNSGITATSLFSIYAPWYVRKAVSNATGLNGANKNATRGTVNGVVLARSAKKDQYGFVGVEGDFPVKVGEDVAAGDVLVPGVGTGAGIGYKITRPDADSTADGDAIPPFATVNHALDVSASSDDLVEATVYCRKLSIVREIAESLIEGTPRPEAV